MEKAMSWPAGRQSPDNNLLRFMSRRLPFPHDLKILDIGSGEGANARELGERGYNVITLDKDPATNPDVCVDICRPGNPPWPFDCILDINTLCHVENPPLEKIKSWLKPGGYFFCITPADDTWRGVGIGKDFTRFSSEADLRMALLDAGFSNLKIKIYGAQYPDFQDHEIKSLIAEARR